MLGRRGLVVGLALLLGGCGAPVWKQAPHDTVYQRAAEPRLHGLVEEPEDSDWWPYITGLSTVQLSRMVSPGYHLSRRPGGPAAEDVNTFGKVPNSTWFENRIGRRSVSLEEIRRGPDTLDGPPKGKLIVKSAKTKGVTPGFIVEDETGQGWVIKFDPPKYPTISTAAEIICTKLMWAAGYHVPENYIGQLDLAQLVLSPKAKTKDELNRKIPLDQVELQKSLDKIVPDRKGPIRAIFSKFLAGRPVGNFTLTGTRLDDPNDVIPHERRRSLRGLWVFFAWINNTDAKPTNNLDTFIEVDEKNGLGYVKHNLIDFGSALGGNPVGPKGKAGGYKYNIDWNELFTRTLAAGFHDPYWYDNVDSPLRGIVGNLEADVFDPPRWKPTYPNPLFDAADPHDTFWAAAILAHITPAHIRAAVEEGRYPVPEATEWVTRALVGRRSKLLRHAFRVMAPLDEPRIEGGQRVTLVDLEVLAGLRRSEDVEYRWALRWNRRGRDLGLSASSSKRPSAHLGGALKWLVEHHRDELVREPFLTLSWTRRVLTDPERSPRVDVHLRLLSDGTLMPVGVERQIR